MYFSELNYTLGDEDSTFEYKILKKEPGKVAAIAGSGGRIIPLLARRPEYISCIDISKYQLGLTELRISLLRELDNEEYIRFLGYKPMSIKERVAIYSRLPLSNETKKSLSFLGPALNKGARIAYLGRFERMLNTIYKVNRIITGGKGRKAFDAITLDDQLSYYQNNFPKKRWALLIKVMANATALNSLLYKGEFPKKNISGTEYEIYRKIFERAFTEQSIRKNFFLQMLFFGEVKYDEGLPIECDSKVYNEAKGALKDIDIELANEDVFDNVSKNKNVDFVSLSDLPSFIIDNSATDFLSKLNNGLAERAIVAVRGHLRVVIPKIEGFVDVSSKFDNFIKQESTGLWHIHVYEKL